jgi:hypothetical protein
MEISLSHRDNPADYTRSTSNEREMRDGDIGGPYRRGPGPPEVPVAPSCPIGKFSQRRSISWSVDDWPYVDHSLPPDQTRRRRRQRSAWCNATPRALSRRFCNLHRGEATGESPTPQPPRAPFPRESPYMYVPCRAKRSSVERVMLDQLCTLTFPISKETLCA